ncbi:MAG: FAD-binding oxidoreductase [Halioglobus sp.]
MRIRTKSGLEFLQLNGKSILSSAESEGLQLSYSCRVGRCSSCKCKVLGGETIALSDELGLSESEKSEGWILSCVRAAASELFLELEDLGSDRLPESKTFPCRISQLEKLSDDVINVVLRLPPGRAFEFFAGQHLEVIGKDRLRRSYSIANAMRSDNQIELHVRAVSGGLMSEYWFEKATVEDLLRINGPLGTFFLRKLKGRHLLFFATGTGIAPVKAMLEWLATAPSDEKPDSIRVYWGGRKIDDLYLDNIAEGLDFQFFPVLSKPHSQWAGAVGYVQNVFLQESGNIENTVVYACGSEAMIHSARHLMTELGLPGQQFFSDAFVSSEPIS